MPRHLASERSRYLPELTIGRLLKIAEEDRRYISLGPGEPDFPPPRNVVSAAKKALEKGFTRYSPVEGIEELRQAAARKLKKENRIDADPKNIIITTSSTEGLLLSLICTTDAGEGVLLPDPGFLAYKPTVEILDGNPISYPLSEEDNFEVNIEKLEELIIPEKTSAIIINSPSNPTGAVFSQKTLEELADFAIEYDILIISDEAYEKYVYDNASHISIASLNGLEERVITLHSFSKSFALPGFRLGYAHVPEKLSSVMKRAHVFTTLCAPTPFQHAGIEALLRTGHYIKKMVSEYDRRRRFLLKWIKKIGLSCSRPKGAFYAFPNIKQLGMKSQKFSEFILKNARVVTIPGTEFGRHGEGYIRLSYATDIKIINEAMERIGKAVKKL